MIIKEFVLDKTPLEFGPYTGRAPNELLDHDPVYLCWLYENTDPKRCSMELYVLADTSREVNVNGC